VSHPSIRLRIDFAPGRALGTGKIDLLERIESTGSLSAAAAAMDMSYKRAWLLLQSLNELFDEPLVVMTKGGRGGGGGAAVTARGREIIAAFRFTERKCRDAAGKAFAALKPRASRSRRKRGVRKLSVRAASARRQTT
jgi:molybdate transport system regulatory protein